MKIQIIVIVAVAVLFGGCDMPYRLRTNDKGKLTIENECGKIKLVSHGVFMKHHYFTIKTVEGSYEIDTDKIKILSGDSAKEINDVEWICNGEKTTGIIILGRGDKLTGHFPLWYSRPPERYRDSVFAFMVLPGDYIMCNGAPMAVDTLRIR